MIYIVTALKSEAQAFVDKYKLQKSSLHNFTSYSNETLYIIVSGVGVHNARIATQTLINTFDITDEDAFYNIGICAAPKQFSIGSCHEIGSIIYDGILHTFKDNAHTILCSDTPQTNHCDTLVDMESFGFYDAVTHNPAITTYHIFKIVSDHFQPHTLSKDMVKALIFRNLSIFSLEKQKFHK